MRLSGSVLTGLYSQFGEHASLFPVLSLLRRRHHSWHVHPLGVLFDHPARAVYRSGGANSFLNQMYPPARDAIAVAVEIERHDFIFEHAIERHSISLIAEFIACAFRRAGVDGPSVGSLVTFVPPAVENAQM